MHLSASALVEAPFFAASLLLVVATAGKLLGAGIPARLSGLSNRDALAVGIGMNARGAVGLASPWLAAIEAAIGGGAIGTVPGGVLGLLRVS
jgi:Kef-type K+ transport system membrane component KefB